jgi:hypothetical protein
MQISRKWEDFLFSTSKDVLAFCKPLFEKTIIDYFDYQLCDNSGSIFILSTHPQFIKEHFTQELYPTAEESLAFISCGHRNTFMSEAAGLPGGASDKNPKKYEDNIRLAKAHKVHHRLYIVDARGDYFRMCGFGVSLDDSSAFEFYLNHLALLERFILYFEWKARDLIYNPAPNHKLILPSYLDAGLHENLNYRFSGQHQSRDPVFAAERFFIELENKAMTFTRREMEFLAFSTKGYSAKETAKRLQVSPKTVENRLYQIKQAIGPVAKQTLRDTLAQHNIFSLFEI